ncbi:MAG: phosphate ABC transporter permease [Dehalococcoidia bacterium]|nr:phosphate ABC transporter permease [Dehalococcoidia bacterium]|tara:strand:- start:3035 stop:3868 length:834 start_codon:yes stop_codon:yes gene_type:complete
MNDSEKHVTIVKPRNTWDILTIRDLWQYRDMLLYLVLRDIKARYTQSVLGIGWAVLQPLFLMIVFTVIFGKLVKINTNGMDYAVFSYTALVPWAYFSNSLMLTTGSLIQNSNLLSKVFFPRLVLPMSTVLSTLVDFFIAFILVIVLMIWYQVSPTIWVLFLPVLLLLMLVLSVSLGSLFAALAIQYRDVRHGITFLVQGMMYASPVVYPVSIIPDKYRLIYGLNPMAGVIEGFRSALLGSTPMPWDLIIVGTIVTLVVAVIGLTYFKFTERIFADVM